MDSCEYCGEPIMEGEDCTTCEASRQTAMAAALAEYKAGSPEARCAVLGHDFKDGVCRRCGAYDGPAS